MLIVHALFSLIIDPLLNYQTFKLNSNSPLPLFTNTTNTIKHKKFENEDTYPSQFNQIQKIKHVYSIK